jgi:hypothetical protein
MGLNRSDAHGSQLEIERFFSWRDLSTDIGQEEYYWMVLEAV